MIDVDTNSLGGALKWMSAAKNGVNRHNINVIYVNEGGLVADSYHEVAIENMASLEELVFVWGKVGTNDVYKTRVIPPFFGVLDVFYANSTTVNAVFADDKFVFNTLSSEYKLHAVLSVKRWNK